MSANLIRRAYRELAEPDRAAWARMQARWLSVAMKRRLKVTIIVGKEATHERARRGDVGDDSAD